MSRRRRALSEDSARTGPPDTGRDPPLPRKRRAPPKGSARTDLPRHSRGTGGGAAITRRRGAALRRKARRALTLKPKSGLPPAAAQCRSPSQQSESLPPRKPRTPGAADAAAPKPARGDGARAGQSPSQRRRAPSEDSARTGPPDTDRDPPLPRKRRAPPEGSARTDLPRNGQGHAGPEKTPRGGAALRQQARRAQTLQPKKGGGRGIGEGASTRPRSSERQPGPLSHRRPGHWAPPGRVATRRWGPRAGARAR